MPSATEYLPPTDAARDGFAVELQREKTARRTIYRTAMDYYRGVHPEQVAHEPGTPNDNTIINLVQMTADRTVSFLFPKVPEFKTTLKTERRRKSAEETVEERWIRDFIEYNGGLKMLTKLALRGFLAGHSFVRVKVAEKGEPYPRIIILDPTSVSVYWRADDVADVLWYEYRYFVGSRVYIQDFVKIAPNTWKIYTYRSTNNNSNNLSGSVTHHGKANVILDTLEFSAGSYEQVGEAAVHLAPVPPIIEFPHLPHPDDYYGLSDFSQQDLQDTINRIASERNRIVRENSDPTDVITGADVDEVQDDGGIVTIASAAAKVQRLEMKGDLSAISDTLQQLIETYLSIARVVLLKGEAKDLQRVTNTSVQILFLDMLSKNNLLRDTYGAALKQVVKLGMMMAFVAGFPGMRNPDTLDLRIDFQSPLPVDLTELANVNVQLVTLGARSLQTAAVSMGDDWDFEREAREDEHQENLRRTKEAQDMMQPEEEETSEEEPIDK